MSESLYHHNAVKEQFELLRAVREISQARRRVAHLTDFQHTIFVARQLIYEGAGGTIVDMYNILVPAQSAIIATSLEVRAAPDSQDVLLPGDWRATDDTAPYRGVAGYNGPGTFRFFDGPTTEKFPAVQDFGLINGGFLFVFSSRMYVQATINPVGVGSKGMSITARMNCYMVPDWIGGALRRIETRINSVDQMVTV